MELKGLSFKNFPLQTEAVRHAAGRSQHTQTCGEIYMLALQFEQNNHSQTQRRIT